MKYCQKQPIHFLKILLACLTCITLLTACGVEEPETNLVTPAKDKADSSHAATDPVAMGIEAMNEADYRRHIEILASDEFGGRAPASPGEELTVDYLVNAFKNLGLEPANHGSYTQDVPLA